MDEEHAYQAAPQQPGPAAYRKGNDQAQDDPQKKRAVDEHDYPIP